jgi:competence protein ComEA
MEDDVRRQLLILIVLAGVACTALAAGDTAERGVVNINTATAEQLQLLPRIGPALADRIIAFREANGPYQKSDELVAVKGIGERSLERLKPYVVTSGETTLKAKVRLPRSGAAAG